MLISVTLIASTLIFYGLISHFHNVNSIVNLEHEYLIVEDWETQNGRGNEEYIIKIVELAEGEGIIIISNFSDLGFDIKATFSNGCITIDTQELATVNLPFIVYGTGAIYEEKLQLTYTLMGGDTNFKAKCVGQRLNAIRKSNEVVKNTNTIHKP